jgi:hypothetical protein
VPWQDIVKSLENLVAEPTEEQVRIANLLGIKLPNGTPSVVVGTIIRHALRHVTLEQFRDSDSIPERLKQLESELGVPKTQKLLTGTREEVSAWFAVRFNQLTTIGLRELQPEPGDIVALKSNPGDQMIISSIDSQGRVHMRGGNGRRAWPNHLQLISRPSLNQDHSVKSQELEAKLQNSTTYRGHSVPSKLSEYKVADSRPSPEAVHALEELLESGEQNEAPFQRILEEYPSLLASLIVGHHDTYVIPQKRLGAEHVTDFLVLGFNSLGPQWLAVELEAPRHALLTKDGALRSEVQHAIKQVQDWREWLTQNVAYAQGQHGLYGLTNQVQGLVLIGRADVSYEREPARNRVKEESDIHIHSWDWLLRQTIMYANDSTQVAFHR